MRGDSAAQDVVGTVLLVALTIALGSALAVVVTTTIQEPAPTDASLALAPVAPGASALALRFTNGEPIPLPALRVDLSRDGGPAADVPPSAWTTSDPQTLRPGDALSFPLSPAAGASETLRVRVFRDDANALLAEFAARTGGASAASPAVTLIAAVSPSSLPADATTTGLLAVRVSTTAGALGVARVEANLSGIAAAAGSGPLQVTLADDGADGDAQGADGTWSGLVVLPRSTPMGAYPIPIQAIDPAGVVVGTATATVTAAAPATAGPARLSEGVSFGVPTSANATSLRLRNWTWDALHPTRLANDALTIRVVGAGGVWVASMTFDSCTGGVPCLKTLTAWNGLNETAYAPRNATLPLSGLDLNLLNPVGSLQLVRSSGAADPRALYPASAVGGEPTFVVAFLGDERTQAPLDAGLLSVDLAVT